MSEPEQLCCSRMQSCFLKNGAFFFPPEEQYFASSN